MIDPLTFALAFIASLAVHVYFREKRIRARRREFDGGWSHDNGPRVTRILSNHITTVKGDRN